VAIPYFQDRFTGREPQLLGLILLIAVFLLPTLHPGRMGWITSLVPLPVFYYLVRLGKKEGSILIRNAILISGGAALITGSLPLLFFSLTLVPLGIAFSLALFNKASPVEAGLKGSLVLGVAWVLFWMVFGFVHDANPYTSLLNELDQCSRFVEELHSADSTGPVDLRGTQYNLVKPGPGELAPEKSSCQPDSLACLQRLETAGYTCLGFYCRCCFIGTAACPFEFARPEYHNYLGDSVFFPRFGHSIQLTF